MKAAGPSVRDGIREKNGLKAKIELCTTTAQRRVDTLALLASWLSDVGSRPCRTRSARPTSSPTTTRRRSTPRAPCRTRTSTSRSTRSRPRSTRWVATSAITAASSSRTARTMPRSTNRRPRHAPTTPFSRTVDFADIKAAMATVQTVFHDLTVEIPLYYRGQHRAPRAARWELLRQRHPGRHDLERGRLVRQRVVTAPPVV